VSKLTERAADARLEDPISVVMVRRAYFTVPSSFAVPVTDVIVDFVADAPARTRRDTAYFDTSHWDLADAGVTVRRDRVANHHEWTLEIAADLSARYPIVRALNYGDLGGSREVPAKVVRYLRRHHRRHGLQQVAKATGCATSTALRPRRDYPALLEFRDEYLNVARVGRTTTPIRRITVVTHDLDGVGRRALEAAATSLAGAGCHLEAVSAELLTYGGG
jgi:hypothetical protein